MKLQIDAKQPYQIDAVSAVVDKLTYPEQTEGSRLAARVRKLASKLTPEEEAEHFRRGMVKIYGGQPTEITGAGH